jgi:hypothetical protein
MKIELRLVPETAIIIAATIEVVYNYKALTRRQKSTLSIAIDVAAKLDAKAVHLKAQMNSLKSKKKIKISLKFHEADMLELLLMQQIKEVHEPYIRLQIQNIINDLNQKLA